MTEGAVMQGYIKEVLENIPSDWLKLTTHRLDIYNEKLAKVEFIAELEKLAFSNNLTEEALSSLPTAFDYIRLGHPLSCVLEWSISKELEVNSERVISFSSQITPILAILRKNLFERKNTQILYTKSLPKGFDEKLIKEVYGYNFELKELQIPSDLNDFNGSTLLISDSSNIHEFDTGSEVDFILNTHPNWGSILLVNDIESEKYISEIQHVRRRETIAMTPVNCQAILRLMVGISSEVQSATTSQNHKDKVLAQIKDITGTDVQAAVGSSGLSIQYAIVMGLIDYALEHHPGKKVKIIVPPNCYGGTNDQARRVAACLPHVEVMDLPVDGGNDMTKSINTVLDQIAEMNAVPLILAEIPTNPRVEVPDLQELKSVLSADRQIPNGHPAVRPVFILDQTFCPNVQFLSEKDTLSSVQSISYSSGSKFPSGGLCNAGYCVANKKAAKLMGRIQAHLILCDNEATEHQYEILAAQLPSVIQRISDAYKNTREFVDFIKEVLPEAKINFVSEELAELGFTPSVFSLDLPTKGEDDESREIYKRMLNLKLINLMISEIPDESKYCVSYGQLKGCYWTVPATSTQGTTKEGDKDYIARVALSPDMDLEHHKKVFLAFVNSL